MPPIKQLEDLEDGLRAAETRSHEFDDVTGCDGYVSGSSRGVYADEEYLGKSRRNSDVILDTPSDDALDENSTPFRKWVSVMFSCLKPPEYHFNENSKVIIYMRLF